MRVKFILPALAEASRRHWRPIKYSLFPPLGLAALAGHLDDRDHADIQDEHVEPLTLDDDPEVVAIEVYVTSAYRSYRLADHYRARGAHVCLGGLHVTALPREAARHADSIFLGPGEDTWPRFLADFRAGRARRVYRSTRRTLDGAPPVRRDLIDRRLYLAPNALVVSRGCPHACEFCYKDAFFRGGRSFYTQGVDAALAEIDRLPGRHLFFMDDNLFGSPPFASALFEGMRGMGRVWQAAATVRAVANAPLMAQAVRAGLRSLFIGFETLSDAGLRSVGKAQNRTRDYDRAVQRLRDLGVMVNASFVFGFDADDETVFDRTIDWAVGAGIETASLHILTPYPGTALHSRLAGQGRLRTRNWELYDTRHAVFRPARMTPQALEAGYGRAYRRFYRWSAIGRAARTKPTWRRRLRHVAYAGAWKKMEPLWGWIIRTGRLPRMGPLLESLLGGLGRRRPAKRPGLPGVRQARHAARGQDGAQAGRRLSETGKRRWPSRSAGTGRSRISSQPLR